MDVPGTLLEGAGSLGISLDERALERFDIYLRVLLEWNQKHNLTAIRDRDEIVTRHFLDALTCVRAYDFTTRRPVLDVATGAGFPGLPLKIAFPDLDLSLLDSSIKKVEFLGHLCPLLGWTEVDIAHGRAEMFAHVGSYRQKFHLVLCRGLAALPSLTEMCLPFVTVGGYLLAQKGPDVDPEIAAAAEGVQILGGGEIERIDVGVPGTKIQHTLIRIRKEESTPSRYPRRPGMPVKRPMGTTSGRPHPHPKYR